MRLYKPTSIEASLAFREQTTSYVLRVPRKNCIEIAMDDQIIGVVQVPIANLKFRRDLAPRELDPQICQYLAPIIRHDARHYEPRNRIEGIVDREELALILADLRCTVEQLNCTLHNGRFPLLLNRTIQYIHGQHRIEAAKLVLVQMWTVELRLYEDLSHANLYHVGSVRDQAEQFMHQTAYRDGDIYLRIQDSRDEQDATGGKKWTKRLTKGKTRALRSIYQRDNLSCQLQALRPFTGLWPGKVFGNWAHFLALHIEPEICSYFERMCQVYRRLTCGDPSCLDAETVKYIEGRAPSASDFDSDLLVRAYDSGQIFQKVTSPDQRSAIRVELLTVDLVLPSFRTFNENMKYFSTAARIIRNLILDPEEEERKEERSSTGRQGTRADKPVPTLAEALRSCWSPPQVPVVEISQGEFQPLTVPLTFELAYQQLFLMAQRYFPYLNHRYGPRRQEGQGITPVIKPGTKILFYRSAKFVGFSNRQIEEGAVQELDVSVPICEDVPIHATSLKQKSHRWGRPHVLTFRVIQQIAFLPQLVDCPERSLYPSVLFVFRDLFRAFLGSSTFTVDWSQRAISVYHEPWGVGNMPDRSQITRPLARIPEEPLPQHEDVDMDAPSPNYEEPCPIQRDVTMQDAAVEEQTLTRDLPMESGYDKSHEMARGHRVNSTGYRTTTGATIRPPSSNLFFPPATELPQSPATPAPSSLHFVDRTLVSMLSTPALSRPATSWTNPSTAVPTPDRALSQLAMLERVPSNSSSAFTRNPYWSSILGGSESSSSYPSRIPSARNSGQRPSPTLHIADQFQPLNPYLDSPGQWDDVRLTPFEHRSSTPFPTLPYGEKASVISPASTCFSIPRPMSGPSTASLSNQSVRSFSVTGSSRSTLPWPSVTNSQPSLAGGLNRSQVSTMYDHSSRNSQHQGGTTLSTPYSASAMSLVQRKSFGGDKHGSNQLRRSGKESQTLGTQGWDYSDDEY